jgi:hypothetical protein
VFQGFPGLVHGSTVNLQKFQGVLKYRAVSKTPFSPPPARRKHMPEGEMEEGGITAD